jgi:hypothetical protein
VAPGDKLVMAMRRVLAGLVAALFLAAAVSLLPIWPESNERGAATRAGSDARPAEAKPVEPVLAGTTLDGQAVRVPAGRPAVLFFFTVGCGTCFPGAQQVVDARGRAGGAADYLAVNLDPREPGTLIEQFFTAAGAADFPVVPDPDMTKGAEFRVEALGTLLVIDPHGREMFRKVDPSAAEIVAAVRDASAP